MPIQIFFLGGRGEKAQKRLQTRSPSGRDLSNTLDLVRPQELQQPSEAYIVQVPVQIHQDDEAVMYSLASASANTRTTDVQGH